MLKVHCMKSAKLQIKEMAITDLELSKAVYNPRTIDTASKNGLRESLDRFGYVQPIIFNEKTKTIVSGHQRLDILSEEGFETAEVHMVNLSVEDEKKLNILMNSKTITGAFTDDINQMLDDILDADPSMFDMTGLGDLYQILNDDKKDTDPLQNENKDIVKGMELIPYESYDAILIVCKRRDDFMFLSSGLGLGEKRIVSSPSVQNKKLGYVRCVDAGQVIKLIEGDQNDLAINKL